MIFDDRFYLEIALEEGIKSGKEGTHPIGAIIVAPSGEIISRGRNRIYTTWDSSAHAEIDAIRNAGKYLFGKENKFIHTLYTSVEPCPMCAGAILLADIGRVVWALNDNYMGAFRTLKTGKRFRDRLDRIHFSAAPYEDLAIKQERIYKEWDEGRGQAYEVSKLE